jgi:SNF2 family DNA or RNA helicase
VVCPASLGLHWEQEVGKFFPGTLLRPHRYSKAFRDLSVLGGGDVLIVSYDALRSQLAAFQGILWEYIVLDEAHLIRNPRTATARAVFSLRSRHRMALSGTPVQNQVEELWSLLNFLVPDYLGDYSSFRKQSVLPILKAMNERQYLQDTERDIFRSVVSSAEEEDRNAERSKKDIKKADKVLAKFQEAVQLSAEGVALLRVLHKQVCNCEP